MPAEEGFQYGKYLIEESDIAATLLIISGCNRQEEKVRTGLDSQYAKRQEDFCHQSIIET